MDKGIFVITNVRLNYIKSGISILIKMGAHLICLGGSIN